MERSSSCTYGRKHTLTPVWLLVIALSLLPIKAVIAQPDTESKIQHIAKIRTMIDDASRLQLTQKQVGGFWEQVALDYQDLTEFPQAETAYNNALSLFEHDPDAQEYYAVTLDNLGSLYGMTQRFDAEENCRKRSLEIF